jgi:NAD-dependent SIR2 family protein deacetylase
MAVDTELRRRKKLEDVDSLDDVVRLIQSSKNIMVLAGAGISKTVKPFLITGISTSCGIPDFRSDTGIYSMLADYGLDDPQVFTLRRITSNSKGHVRYRGIPT